MKPLLALSIICGIAGTLCGVTLGIQAGTWKGEAQCYSSIMDGQTATMKMLKGDK